MALIDGDLFSRGLDYLYQIRALAVEPDLIQIIYHLEERISVCTWIGQHIDTVNAVLQQQVQACQACFHPWEQRSIQIFAAPFADVFGIDGLCSLADCPITLLVDVGRVVPQDWLALVAHEFAHAQVGSPGHSAEFVRVLTHLCLGLGLMLPGETVSAEDWCSLPLYRKTANPIAFWQGCSTVTPAD
jgi:hypothetical protein